MGCFLTMMNIEYSSSIETHISTSNTLVRVSNSAEKPLSNGSSSAISTEEVIENSSVEGTNSTLTKVIVVSLDLGAAIVMRVLNKNFNHIGIFTTELSQVLVILVKSVVLHGGDETIKLLFLIAVSVFLYNNSTSQVLK